MVEMVPNATKGLILQNKKLLKTTSSKQSAPLDSTKTGSQHCLRNSISKSCVSEVKLKNKYFSWCISKKLVRTQCFIKLLDCINEAMLIQKFPDKLKKQ